MYALNSGQHRPLVEGRESGARLDQLLITNDLNFKPNCVGDSEPDGDVDTVDLFDVIHSGSVNIDTLGKEFGRVNCQN